ncbi:MAG: hypothetical protein AAF708_18245, partial [Deinococcota bacterium]
MMFSLVRLPYIIVSVVVDVRNTRTSTIIVMTSPLSKLNQDTHSAGYDGLAAMVLQETDLREDQLSTQTDVLSEHGTGESYDDVVLPDIVVYPESTADV